jgi:hypothetical protein
MNLYDDMIATNIDLPTPPAEEPAAPLVAVRPRQAVAITPPINTPTTAAPMAMARPQQAISAASVVQPIKTPTLEAAAIVQAVVAPRVAGGALTAAAESPVTAVPMQQQQATPQAITPISQLKLA